MPDNNLQPLYKINGHEVARFLGMPKGSSGRYWCPYCQCDSRNHKTPDLDIYSWSGIWRYHCHKCDESGTMIGLVMVKKGCDEAAAVEYLKNGLTHISSSPPPVEKPALAPKDIANHSVIYGAFLSQVCVPVKGSAAEEYLVSKRCVSIEVIERAGVRFCPGGYLNKMWKIMNRSDIEKSGLSAFCHFQNKDINLPFIVFPYYLDGRVVSIKARCFLSKEELEDLSKNRGKEILRFVNTKGAELYLYNHDAIAKVNKIFIAEGEIDALTLISRGFDAVGLPGAGGWKDSYIQSLKGKEVVLVLDSDKAGQCAVKDIRSKFVEFKLPSPGAVNMENLRFRLGVPKEAKDINDFVRCYESSLVELLPFDKDNKWVLEQLGGCDLCAFRSVEGGYEFIAEGDDFVARISDQAFPSIAAAITNQWVVVCDSGSLISEAFKKHGHTPKVLDLSLAYSLLSLPCTPPAFSSYIDEYARLNGLLLGKSLAYEFILRNAQRGGWTLKLSTPVEWVAIQENGDGYELLRAGAKTPDKITKQSIALAVRQVGDGLILVNAPSGELWRVLEEKKKFFDIDLASKTLNLSRSKKPITVDQFHCQYLKLIGALRVLPEVAERMEYELNRSLLPVLAKMERVGVPVNIDKLEGRHDLLMDVKDGRIHPKYDLASDITGRIASSGPAVSKIPSVSVEALRGALICVSYEKVFFCASQKALDLFTDPHDIVDSFADLASHLFRKDACAVTREDRLKAKVIWGGTMLGETEPDVMQDAARRYGVDLSIEDAYGLNQRLLELAPGLLATKFEPERYIEAVSTRSTLTKHALKAIDEALSGYEASVVCVLEDEVVIEVSAAQTKEVMAVVRKATSDVLREVGGGDISNEVTAAVGKSWNTVREETIPVVAGRTPVATG